MRKKHTCKNCINSNCSCKENGSIVLFGNLTLNVAAVTEYLSPGYSDSPANIGLVPRFRSPVTGTFRNLYVRQEPGSPPGTSLNVTYRLRINGIATVLSVVLNSASADAFIMRNVVVTKGDLVDFEVVHGDLGVQAPQMVLATLELST